jgi:hypothetical protein
MHTANWANFRAILITTSVLAGVRAKVRQNQNPDTGLSLTLSHDAETQVQMRHQLSLLPYRVTGGP